MISYLSFSYTVSLIDMDVIKFNINIKHIYFICSMPKNSTISQFQNMTLAPRACYHGSHE